MDETMKSWLVNKACGSVSSLPRKFLQMIGKSQEDFFISYIEDSGGSKLMESLEFGGLGRSLFTIDFESPPEAKRPWEDVHYSPPNMGTGKSAGTLGMQGGLVILMFAVCYMLYMLLKKRVCSFTIGWKDTVDVGELELGGPRDA